MVHHFFRFMHSHPDSYLTYWKTNRHPVTMSCIPFQWILEQTSISIPYVMPRLKQTTKKSTQVSKFILRLQFWASIRCPSDVKMTSTPDPYDFDNARGWRSYRLLRPGRGMYHDIRRRLPYYRSDITDALTYRTFASTVRIYFVKLVLPSPVVLRSSSAT